MGRRDRYEILKCHRHFLLLYCHLSAPFSIPLQRTNFVSVLFSFFCHFCSFLSLCSSIKTLLSADKVIVLTIPLLTFLHVIIKLNLLLSIFIFCIVLFFLLLLLLIFPFSCVIIFHHDFLNFVFTQRNTSATLPQCVFE